MVDATKVSKIRIDTGYAGVKEYPFFTRVNRGDLTIDDAQVSIILGGNGSGKSTVARALKGENKSVEFYDKGGNSLGGDCSNIYVYNESFVIKNFRIYEHSSLEPVVLLGDFNQKMARIDGLRKDIERCKNKISSLKQNILSRVFDKNSSVKMIEVCDFTVGEYISYCIENELEDKYILYKIGQPGSGKYINSFEESEYTNSYLRWVALDYLSVWSAVEEEVGDVDKMRFDYEELTHQLDSFKESSNYESLLTSEGLLEQRWEVAKQISCFIYDIYPDLHDGSKNGFSSAKERENFHDLKLERMFLEGRYMKECESLVIDQKKYSAGSIIQYMNQWLHIVFGENNICLEADRDFGYKVKVGNREISPKHLSVGEQNILSLCYFFANLCTGENPDNFLTKDQIIILDDPVSSFDDSNKYGVTSLLGYLCQSILDKSSKTKLIIMTHDSSFAFNMSKMVKAIDDSKLSCWELQKDSSDVLIKSKFEDVDRYADMLRIMYDFAVPSQKNAVVPAPNDVRRVWEAFLMFELGETSIANMDSLKKMSGCFSKNQKIERFMRVFIPQLFINNDSHAKSQVMNGNLYLTPTLEGKPYEDFVKNIVCFMHLVSPRHIAWRMKKTQEENVHESVAKLDNLVREVLDDPKIVAATSSWQGIQGLRRARHRGGRVPLSLRQ
ncbi:MAG: hypothetical protein EGW04_02270 [Rothia mucilaginosa]|nr:hypothetical protein [Rothia mucilaginosa]